MKPPSVPVRRPAPLRRSDIPAAGPARRVSGTGSVLGAILDHGPVARSNVARLTGLSEFFRVDGPLNVQRPPQGYPLLVQAGSSGDGKDFAARYAVVPILQERGLFRTEYTGSTLREHYGLPRPANRLFDAVGAPDRLVEESAA